MLSFQSTEIWIHRNSNALCRNKSGKVHVVLRLYITYVKLSTVKKSIYVSHLMSIFRKSDTNQFMYRVRCQMKMSDEQQKHISCNGKTISSQWIINNVNLTWLNHGTHGTMVPKLEKERSNSTCTQSKKQKMSNSYRTQPNAINCLQYTIFRILQNHFFHSVLACTPCSATHVHIIFKSYLHTLSSRTIKIITHMLEFICFVFIPIGWFCYFLVYFSTLKMVQRWEISPTNTKWSKECVKKLCLNYNAL